MPALFFRDTGYTEAYYASRGLSCPAPLNCTWDEFPTLGLCYKTAALSKADWHTDCQEGDDSGCSYNIRGMTQFEIAEDFVFESKEVLANISNKWFNINNPLLTLVSLKRRKNREGKDRVNNATVTSFYPCVYTASSNVVNGLYTFRLLHSWRNESASVPDNSLTAKLTDIYMTPSQDQLHLAGKPFEPATYRIPGPVADLMRTTLRSTLVVRAGVSSNGSVEAAFAYEGYGNSKLVAFSFLTAAGVWEEIFASLTFGATSYIRGIEENTKYQVGGYQVSDFTIINVRWAWITLPASLFSFTILFLIVTIHTNRFLPAYKNSVLPLFFLSKEYEGRLSKPFTRDEMKEEAKTTKVKPDLIKRDR